MRAAICACQLASAALERADVVRSSVARSCFRSASACTRFCSSACRCASSWRIRSLFCGRLALSLRSLLSLPLRLILALLLLLLLLLEFALLSGLLLGLLFLLLILQHLLALRELLRSRLRRSSRLFRRRLRGRSGGGGGGRGGGWLGRLGGDLLQGGAQAA